MFKKLRNKAVFSFCIFLCIVVGGTYLFYYLFSEEFYVMKKKKVMNEAFQVLKTLDLDDTSLEYHTFFQKYEEESFFLLICDEKFQTVYVSGGKSKERSERTQMQKNQKRYVIDAKATANRTEEGTKICLRGKIVQDGGTYYVFIYENTGILQKSISYVQDFSRYVLLVLVILGRIFACFAAVRIAKPVEEMNRITQKIAENDFSVRVKVPTSDDELGCLARSINQMAEKIQRDMNELNNYNYLLIKKNKDMAEFEDMRKVFVTKVTHELKTPLAIISSQVQMLQYDESKKEYYCESIMEEIDKMSHMISQLLNDSFLEDRQKQTKVERRDVSALVQYMIPKYEAWLSTKKIRFLTEIEKDCYADIDPVQIEQAIGNYIMNGYNHTKSGGTMRLLLRKEEKMLYLSVYNEGERISESEREKIWEKFMQLGTSEENDGRVGLGLYIVRDIVQAHSGQCGVENREQGVEFWIRIPKG